jgi:hypothetical protein
MTQSQMVGQPDQADPQKLNEDIWKAVKGPHVRMPEPQHHVIGNGSDDEQASKNNASVGW